jgi:uncharacterized Rossmann fold enzyme
VTSSTIDTSAATLAANLGALPRATALAIRTAPDEVLTDVQGTVVRAAVRTRDGRLVLVHAPGDPLAAADALLDQHSDAPLLIVIGIGLGYLLDAIERRGAATKVLAVEPRTAIARAFLSRRDCRQWITTRRLALLVGPTYADATEAWRVFGRTPETPPILVSPLVREEFPAEAEAARVAAVRVIAGVTANAAARRKFAGRYLLNTLTNLPAIVTEGDAGRITGALRGLPAVIVAAGPSLDRNLPALRLLNDRAVILAVDTAVRPLLTAGIEPHVVVSVDPSDINAQHLTGLPRTRFALVGEGSLHPTVFPEFEGRLFTFRVSDHHPWPWLRQHGCERGSLQAWGSVLTTAFDFAIRAGCDPLVFVGADLAYTRGLQYCRNTVYEPRWSHLTTDEARADEFKNYLSRKPHTLAPDVHGQPVITTREFTQFRDWIVARAANATGCRVYNATGGGTLHGAPIVQEPLEDIQLPDVTVTSTVGRALAAARDRSEGDAHRLVLDALGRGMALPLDEWVEFGGDTATREEMVRAVTTASADLRGRRAAGRRGAGVKCRPATTSPTLEDFAGIHRGKRCFLIGNGPSLASLDLTKLRGEVAFIVNRGYLAAAQGLPEVPYYVLSDPTTYIPYCEEIRQARVTTRFYRADVMDCPAYADAPDREAAIRMPFHMAPTMDEGFFAEDAAQGVYRAFTVLGDAAQLAFMMGCSEAYVIGCDLDYHASGMFFYGTPAADAHRRDVMPIDRVRAAMAVAAETFRRDGRVFANAGVGGRLDTIPRVDYASLFP